jgi:hypothetical protein
VVYQVILLHERINVIKLLGIAARRGVKFNQCAACCFDDLREGLHIYAKHVHGEFLRPTGTLPDTENGG